MKMKTNQFLGSLIAVFMGIVLFAPSNALAAAFGASPPWIESNNLKPGSNFVYEINLSVNDLPEDMMVHSELAGDPELTQWLIIQNQDSLKMSKGKSILPMTVNVNIPNDAKLGKYQGNLKLSLVPGTKRTKDIAILLGGNITIDLEVVGHDVTDYWIQEISTNPIIEGQPISLNARIKNLGNTDITNVETSVAIVDMKTGVELASSLVDQLNVTVQPNTMIETRLSAPVQNLKAGNYWLDVESFKGSEPAYKNRLYLTVLPLSISNTVSTGVMVVEEAQLKQAAPVEGQFGASANVQTTVKVRAPLTNQLIAVVIGLLVILIGIVMKFYITFKRRRR